jgi:signal transduction histidine kinase
VRSYARLHAGSRTCDGGERLRSSERLASIGTLAAGIAHEINNPVGIIPLAAQNAIRSKDRPEPDPGTRTPFEKIIANANRCSRIVKSVLQFARHEPTEKWPSDINAMVGDAIELPASFAAQRKAIVSTELATGLPSVMANPIQMEQVLVNLVRNAIEAGPRGVHVDVRTDQAADKVRIMIHDGSSAGWRGSVL